MSSTDRHCKALPRTPTDLAAFEHLEETAADEYLGMELCVPICCLLGQVASQRQHTVCQQAPGFFRPLLLAAAACGHGCIDSAVMMTMILGSASRPLLNPGEPLQPYGSGQARHKAPQQAYLSNLLCICHEVDQHADLHAVPSLVQESLAVWYTTCALEYCCGKMDTLSPDMSQGR